MSGAVIQAEWIKREPSGVVVRITIPFDRDPDTISDQEIVSAFRVAIVELGESEVHDTRK